MSWCLRLVPSLHALKLFHLWNSSHAPAMNSQDALLSDINKDLVGRNTITSAATQDREHGAHTKRILLTGGAGFIGSVLLRKLVLNYPEYFILVIDKLDYCSSLNNMHPFLPKTSASSPYPNFKFLRGDITDLKTVQAAMMDYQIDTVLHLAAQTHVDKSFGESIDFTNNNVLGTHVMLEAARVVFSSAVPRKGTPEDGLNSGPKCEKRFIFVSTDEVYGAVPFDKPDAKEEAPLAPSNPYSATKAAAECMVQAYHKSFRLPVIITRSNNVYGPFQYPEKIFPKFIMNLLKNGTGSGSIGDTGNGVDTLPSHLDLMQSNNNGGHCYIHGSGRHSRTYLYVTDVANALDVILHRGEIGQVYNIGGGHETSNLELAQDLIHRIVVPVDVLDGQKQPTAVDKERVLKSERVYPAENRNQPNGHQLDEGDRPLYLESGSGMVCDRDHPVHSFNANSGNRAAQHLKDCKMCADRILFVEDRAFNDLRYAVDATKLIGLGWSPKVPFEDGITKTIAWFQKHGRSWWGDIHGALYPHSVRLSADDQTALSAPSSSLPSQPTSPSDTPCSKPSFLSQSCGSAAGSEPDVVPSE